MNSRASLTLWSALLLAAAAVFAQNDSGRISGAILDSTGAIVIGATVTALNTETGIEHAAASSREGDYVLYPLPPGVYTLSVFAPGFRGERIDGIRVDVAAVLIRDVRLLVGDVQQQVVVSAAAEPMLTESGSVESTITREQIDTLPLNGRDFNQLVLLAPGAVENVYPGGDFGPVASNGNRSFSNDYMLDGTPNDNVFGGGSAAAVSVDVIREFKVMSGVAPAEYGLAGTHISVSTRSGANRLHGSAFEYHRGTTWQASNPFAPGAPQPFHRDQFGGSIGGPVRPDRTFFLFHYEGNRQSPPSTLLSTLPFHPSRRS